jgi:hypothetical protein
MRTWVKVTIGTVGIVVLGIATLAGIGSYYVFRHLETSKGAEAETLKEFDALRTRFGPRLPLIEIVNPRIADIRVNRTTHPDGLRASTVHAISWSAENGRVQADVPLWLMRFSSFNVLSTLGMAPEKFRLTVSDIARYGPGIVAEYRQPGRSDVIVWVD